MTETTERKGLEIAETVLVVGSIAGTVAAIAGQQVIYAAAPLSLAMSLNLFNRRRFEQTFQQNMTVVLSEMATRVRQVDQQLSGEIESVRSSVKTLSPESESVNIEPIKTEISQLQKRFDTLEETIGSIASTNKLSEKEETIEILSQPTSGVAARFDPTYLEKQIEELKTVVKNKQPEKIETVTKKEIQQLQANISSLTEGFNHRLEQVRQITSDVQYHLSTLPPSPGNNTESSYIEQQIQQLQANFSSLSQAFNQRDELKTVEELKIIAAEFQAQMAAIPPNDRQTKPQQAEESQPVIVHLEAEIQQLKAELQSLQKQNPTPVPGEIVDAVEIESIYNEASPSSSNPLRSIGVRINRLGECIAHYQQQFFQPQHSAASSETEILELVEEIESSAKKTDAGLNNWTETLVAKMLKMFDATAEKEKEITPAGQFDDLLDEIKRAAEEEEASRIQQEAVNSEEIESTSTKTVTLESLIELARENGIEEEFNLAIEAGKKYNLTLNPWPTNLMFSPPTELLSGGKPNSSKCLFIISAQTTPQGKIKLWLSPQTFAEFYQQTPATINSILGEDGWRETEKADIKTFVGNLEILFQQMADRLLKTI